MHLIMTLQILRSIERCLETYSQKLTIILLELQHISYAKEAEGASKTVRSVHTVQTYDLTVPTERTPCRHMSVQKL